MRFLAYLSIIALLVVACQKEDPQLGPAPTSADAQFSYTESQQTPNILNLTAASQDVQCVWDLGNGVTKNGNNVTAEYPYAGTYTITLTIFAKGGSASSSQDVVIAQDDLSLLSNPVYGFLTGGTSGPGSKTWYIDSLVSGHFGVGPDPESALGPVPEWWSAGPGDKPGTGLYSDRYTFYLNGFGFDMVTNGSVYVHNSLAGDFPGSYENLGDYTAPYSDQLNESWSLNEADNTITVSNNSFIGFFSGYREYRIIDISDSTLSLQYKHHEGGLHWYLKLKSE